MHPQDFQMPTDVWVNSKMCIKFPFEPYECQRVFMKNVVDVLDTKMDAALESPTGTGKTLSLLCATLAWVQREKEIKPMDFAAWQAQNSSRNEPVSIEKMKSSFVPTIYYASRTHSQLEQVVSELNRTEYKWVKTTILGSREHFCINTKVKKIVESNRQSHVCRGMVSKRTCHFYNKFEATSSEKMGELMDKGAAMDIEEIVKIGNSYSICPYFMSRQRAETAELILLPYNYVIDPKMRRRYKLDLKDSIVIFDEAHNLESICESNASAEISSTHLAMAIEEIKKVLALVAEEEEQARLEGDETTEAFGSGKMDLSKKLIENLRIEDLMAVLEKMFKLEEEFENVWKTENILKSVENLDGKACSGEVLLGIFEKCGFDGNSLERVVDVLRDSTSYLLGKGEEISLAEKGDGMEKLADFVLSVFSTHAQEVAAAVGEEGMKLADRVDPRMVARNCRLFMRKEENGKLHIKYFCFQASISMRMLKMRGVRNVLLASGTLSPIQSFTYNMGLNFGAILENEHALKTVPVLTSVVMRGYKTALTGTYSNRGNQEYVNDVAETIIRTLEETPQGVIVFFASYSQMEQLINGWKIGKRGNGIEGFWEKMEKTKMILVEPRAKEELVKVRMRYIQGVRSEKGAAFFAVCRGKVSEGIDFCDAESRAVVIVGIPYPPVNDERVVLKKMFLDEVIGAGKKDGQSSKDWYQMEAFRAVNQAIGRVLRHKDDFGVVVLVDSRYASVKLEMFPKWLRGTINRGDLKDCAAKVKRFFGERKEMIEVSVEGFKRKVAVVGKQARKIEGNSQISQMSLDELFGPSTSCCIKSEVSENSEIENFDQPSTSKSGFLLPTNEDEMVRKVEKEQNKELKNSFLTNKRKAGNEVNCQQPVVKKRIVLVSKYPSKYEKALKIGTAEIVKEIAENDKKEFATVLKMYKMEKIGWKEVFDKFEEMFVKKCRNEELFIGCSNILRPEDRPKYLKLVQDKGI